jgi:hypothetical protein
MQPILALPLQKTTFFRLSDILTGPKYFQSPHQGFSNMSRSICTGSTHLTDHAGLTSAKTIEQVIRI